MSITLEDVQRARAVVKGQVHETPLTPSTSFSALAGCHVWLKRENLQRTGSFKIRGALNKINALSDDEKAHGVVAASAGNHAQGVALAARKAGVSAKIVMPVRAPLQKAQAVRGYGADLVSFGKDYSDAEAKAREIQEAEGRTFVHAFDDPLIMAGQGTVGLEIMEQLPSVDTIVVPVGGGGLIAGIATAAKALKPDIRVIGVEPTGAAKLPESLRKGVVVPLPGVNTIADGLATRKVGAAPFPIIREKVDQVVSVGDEDIAAAILLLLERAKTVAEGGGATALAALLAKRFPVREDENVAVVLSGGNIDVTLLDHIIQRGLLQTGRSVEFYTVIEDQPGALRDLLVVLADLGANVTTVDHERTRRDVEIMKTGVRVKVDTRGPEHVEHVLETLRKEGYEVRVPGGV